VEVGSTTSAADLRPLIEALAALPFVLSGPRGDGLRTERDRIVRLLEGVVARTSTPDAPLLVVVGGGSGAGKSTLVNTLAGRQVARTGVLRPTTHVPTLVSHPDDRAWFDDQRVLPGRIRIAVDDRPVDDEAHTGADALRVTSSDRIPPGIALLDTPDIDSVEHRNHHVADEALDAADAWVWLATARTYADEVGMAYLRRASARHALRAIVVTQVRPEDRGEVLADVDRLLASHGVTPDLREDIPLLAVEAGRLPDGNAHALAAWLASLAPVERRREVRAAALAGLLDAIPAEIVPLHRAAQAEADAADRLTGAVEQHLASIGDQLDRELEGGLPLRAEVLDRWRSIVGGGERLLRLQTTASQLGDVVRGRLGRSRTTPQLAQEEVAGEVARTVTRLLDRTARAVRLELEAHPAGRDVLAVQPGLRSEDRDRTAAVRDAVLAWQAATAALVEEVGRPRQQRARRQTTAINALATTAILVLFTLSGGLTGGEVGIAAAAAAASQWLLLRVLGEHNVARLLTEMRADLTARVATLAREEQAPTAAAIAACRPPADHLARLADVARLAKPTGGE
jgi:energy-coupling factor transporter ATP-binding protein EcfA2